MSQTLTEWVDHDGGPVPVAPETIVHVRFRDGNETMTATTAHNWDGRGKPEGSCWLHTAEAANAASDIVAYRVVPA